MTTSPSWKRISTELRIPAYEAKQLKKCMTGVAHPKDWKPKDTQMDATMRYANKLMNGHGVEGLRDENAWVDKYFYDIIAVYVNKGDTYDTTLLYDTEHDRYLITSWGDFYEHWLYKNQKGGY